MESEVIINERFLFRYLKVKWLILHCEWIFNPGMILTTHIGCLENVGSLSYVDLPNVETFHCTIYILKITFVRINTSLIRKVCKYGETVKHMEADTSLPHSNSHLKPWILLLTMDTVSCFPFVDQLPQFIFKKISAKCLSE